MRTIGTKASRSSQLRNKKFSKQIACHRSGLLAVVLLTVTGCIAVNPTEGEIACEGNKIRVKGQCVAAGETVCERTEVLLSGECVPKPEGT